MSKYCKTWAVFFSNEIKQVNFYKESINIPLNYYMCTIKNYDKVGDYFRS